MTADEVKDALRRRYPATDYLGAKAIPGAWTTIEEYIGVDLIALSCHSTPASGSVSGVRYPRVGHEIKVSRSDLRRELLRPTKRSPGVTRCHAFYFVVPAGLLTPAELAYDEPEWEDGDFARTPCPFATGQPGAPRPRGFYPDDDPGPCRKGKREGLLIGPLDRRYGAYGYRPHVEYPCETCEGRGWMEKSRVERKAPTLWIPNDVGLIEVDGRGCHVRKTAPVTKHPEPLVSSDEPFHVHQLIRWVSWRPDPRHVGARIAA